MRRLKTKDLLTVARIIKTANMRDELTELAQRTKLLDVTTNEAGLALVVFLMEKLGDEKAGDMLAGLLADVIEIDKADFLDLDLSETAVLLKRISEENDLAAFFKSAGLLQTANS